MREVELGGGERLESLDVGGLHIISSPGLYAYTADSVKLGMSAKCRAGDAVVDLGTGGGILPLLIYGYFRPQKIVGVEIRENAAKLAEKSVYLNELEDKIAILNIPIQQAAEVLGRGAFDVAVSNPPYYKVQ
ncbi:MAG TPA: methyltransferase, partial [Eubacteriales bacterium]|nr:methyltransferase [Eubacteriales bacterium]